MDFVLDASYALAWCFADQGTPQTDAALSRLETGTDAAVVPAIWRLEVWNALGKAVTRNSLSLPHAQAMWAELALLPIRELTNIHNPNLLELAVANNLSVYDACYLQIALQAGLPIATGDRKLANAATLNRLTVLMR